MSKFTKEIAASVAALGLTFSASAQEAGVVTALSGDEGSVVVIRGGSTYSLSVGDPLFEGDRVTTRSNGKVSVSANGCLKSLGAESSVVLNDAFCETEIVQLDGPQNPANSQNGVPVAGGGSNSAIVLGGLGGAALIAAAVGGGGGSDSTPTSP